MVIKQACDLSFGSRQHNSYYSNTYLNKQENTYDENPFASDVVQ